MGTVIQSEVVGELKPEPLAAIIERAQRFDPGAFDELVDMFGQRVFGFLHRMVGNREDAEDLLQEVFLRVVRTLPRYTHQGRFEGWIFRIAANLARDRIRRARRSPTIISMSGEQGDPDGRANWDCADPSHISPDQPAIQREQVDHMQAALGQLSAAEREVITLRHYSALSFAEIAEAMETPLGTALARAHRGLAKLRRIMESAP
ncbi:MAG: sigma-70 family RNA polymerase sigma factor [Phycisphaerae bacterium]|nr:sigma-70 family RNA polymerase sigma factor [Phycisphaerae bacterium]